MRWKNGNLHKCGPGSSSKYHQAGGKYLLNLTKELQVNSILASDRTLTRKKSKKDDFLEHQSILQHALAANPCDGSNANGKLPHLWLSDPSISRFTWDPDQLQRRDWELWLPSDRQFFTRPRDPGQDNRVQGSCWELHHRFTTFFKKFLWLCFCQSWKTAQRRNLGLSDVSVCKRWTSLMWKQSRWNIWRILLCIGVSPNNGWHAHCKPTL